MDAEIISWFARLNASFPLPFDLNTQLRAFYRGPSATAQTESEVFFHSQVRLIKTYSKRKAPFHLEHPIFSIHEEEKALPSPNSSQTTLNFNGDNLLIYLRLPIALMNEKIIAIVDEIIMTVVKTEVNLTSKSPFVNQKSTDNRCFFMY